MRAVPRSRRTYTVLAERGLARRMFYMDLFNLCSVFYLVFDNWRVTKADCLIFINQQLRYLLSTWRLGTGVDSVLDSGAEGPGFKLRPRRC